ncbi:MAG: ATP-dependent 6-phosphofructokinase [Microthrixaceae bacterium]|nr:ATP-dependent 6-phosphofructokinase [Microthrixaceae bacterium]
MSSDTKRIGVMTSGGDCPGLNAAIRAITRRAVHGHGFEVLGIEDAVAGLAHRQARPLSPELLDIDGYDPMLSTGGTILGSINKAIDAVASEIEDGYQALGLDALIAIGGDGSLAILAEHARSGWNLVGIPKTIDNDVALTDQSIGFDTAVRTVSRAAAQLRTTGVSHDRVMILETMGRGAGHLALAAGIASGADAVLIPEIPWSMEGLMAAIEATRSRRSQAFALVVVAEGADPPAGTAVGVSERSERRHHGGVGEALAIAVEEASGGAIEARATVLGHIQRGGEPSPMDTILATEFGIHAVDLVAEGTFDSMVALHGTRIRPVPLADVVSAGSARVDPHEERAHTARSVGIYLGEDPQ